MYWYGDGDGWSIRKGIESLKVDCFGSTLESVLRSAGQKAGQVCSTIITVRCTAGVRL